MVVTETQISQQVLVGILKSLVPGEEPRTIDSATLDWPSVVKLAAATKTQLLMLQGVDRLGFPPPPPLDAQLRELQATCFQQNMANVASSVRVSRILQTHGIDTLLMKGVLRSHEVYGCWDVRSAADIDVLVRHADYRQAGEVLLKHGYWAPVPVNSAWWHHYLGESPYLPATATGPTVDLHHKLDQPGTPALDNAEFLFASSVVRDFGGYKLKVMDPFASLMLAATSFGKALRQHEPCLTNLHEIAFVRASKLELNDDALDAYAAEHGVLRLWRHARNAADMLFRPSTGNGSLSDIEGVMQDLALHSWPQRLLHRTRLLWTWTDGGVTRPARFAGEFARVRASMLSHSSYEKMMRAQ